MSLQIYIYLYVCVLMYVCRYMLKFILFPSLQPPPPSFFFPRDPWSSAFAADEGCLSLTGDQELIFNRMHPLSR